MRDCTCSEMKPGDRVAVFLSTITIFDHTQEERDGYYDELHSDAHSHWFLLHPDAEHLSREYTEGSLVVLEKTEDHGYSTTRWGGNYDPVWHEYLWKIVEEGEES